MLNLMYHKASLFMLAFGLALCFYTIWLDVTGKPKHLVYQAMWATLLFLLFSVRIAMFVK